MGQLHGFAGRTWGQRAYALFAGNTSLLTIAEVIKAARGLVAVHGGQCYNVIFARENTTFVEVMMFWCVCFMLGVCM